jgi:hypothetical protein
MLVAKNTQQSGLILDWLNADPIIFFLLHGRHFVGSQHHQILPLRQNQELSLFILTVIVRKIENHRTYRITLHLRCDIKMTHRETSKF